MPHMKQDFDSLVCRTPLTGPVARRDFLKTTLGVGFAAAVLPVMAQTVIKTDSVGLTTGQITITVNGQSVPVYRAQPIGQTDLPVILVVSEIFGVHEHIADVARRFAKQGYLALAPELFVRQGDPRAYPAIGELIDKVINRVPDTQVMGDLDACVAWASTHGGNTDKLGITGFCWGGRIAWLYAAHNPTVKAGVAWYGRLVASSSGDNLALTPRQPVDIASSLNAPMLGLYGGKDNGIGLDTIEQMQAALSKGSSQSKFVVYPNSGHAFFADYRPSYVEADAKDGWQRCLAWFKAHGVV
ncbi:MAG: dienelactone hydrolase family protein [Glaciimonas sp.]|nr:dienelactone hydrolase family protein [Glaciimonas sp.]